MPEPMEHDGEVVVWIEYQNDHPFSVITETPGGAWRDYDFDWCKAEKCAYYHMSGGGPVGSHAVINRYCEPDPPPGKLWRRPDIPLRENGTDKLLTVEECAERGVIVIDAPLVLGGDEVNPFTSAYEGETVYCAECNDHLPLGYEPPCDHVTWCDHCECYVYEEVHHRRIDEHREDHPATVHKGVNRDA